MSTIAVRKLAIWEGAVFFLCVLGISYVLWPTRPELPNGLLKIPSVFLILFGWAVFCASIGWRLGWSPRTCYVFPTASFMIACLVLSAANWHFFYITGLGAVSGLLCRKLVHPELGWNDVDRPEFISIFSGPRK